MFIIYFIKMQSTNFKWKNFLYLIFFGCFIFYSNSIELIFLDIIFLLSIIIKKLDIEEKTIEVIDKLTIVLLILSLVFLFDFSNIWILIPNYIAAFIYLIYLKFFEKDFEILVKEAVDYQKVIEEKLKERGIDPKKVKKQAKN